MFMFAGPTVKTPRYFLTPETASPPMLADLVINIVSTISKNAQYSVVLESAYPGSRRKLAGLRRSLAFVRMLR